MRDVIATADEEADNRDGVRYVKEDNASGYHTGQTKISALDSNTSHGLRYDPPGSMIDPPPFQSPSTVAVHGLNSN